ncbi:MAG: hypothetical protein D6761_08080 [Candidatus Dadabacteria bacterium]|nr:MAG: hypothetical protein D6761_08080 [Candidatus Dadabacteria bacterium]
MFERISDWIAGLVVAAPRRLIIASLLLTAALGVFSYRIHILDDLTRVIPESSPVRQAMTRLEQTFGPSETVVIMATAPGGDIFEADFLGRLQRFTTALAAQRPFMRVQGLATLNIYERDEEGTLKPRPILDRAPASDSDVTRIRQDVLGDADISRAFVSRDRAHTAIYVDPKKHYADSEILAAIEAARADVAPFEIATTGMPVIRAATTQAIRHDMAVMIPFVVLILTAFLGWTFRTATGVILTVLIVGFAILPGAGLMGLLGIPMTAINNTFPVLILAIACAGAIHILSVYYRRLKQGFTREDAVRSVVGELTLPVLIAAMTTAVGFLSLMLSPIPPIGVLGWVVALGVVWAWFLSTFVLPAVLLLLPIPRRVVDGEHRGDWFFERLSALVTQRPRTVLLVISVGLVVVAAMGMPRLTRETRVERFFSEDTPARRDAELIDEVFRGSTPLEVIVHADVKQAAVLRQVATFARAVQDLPQVGSVDSILAILERLFEGLLGMREIPDDDFMVSQALLMYSLSTPPEQLQRFVATDEQSFRVTIRMPNLAPDELEGVLKQVRALADKHLTGLDVEMTGKALFLSELSAMVVSSAMRSVLFSLGLVFLICLITFRSLSAGLEGMAPLAVAVLGVFGTMGLLGIPLTIASALVSAIVIGVGVDYGVHVLSRWSLHHGTDLEHRVSETIAEVGRPILLNAVAVGFGLGVLSLSQFQPIQHLGMLSVLAMATSSFGALLVIPALKMLRKPQGDSQ